MIKDSTFFNIKSNKSYSAYAKQKEKSYYNKNSNLGKLYFSSYSDLDKDLKFNLVNLDPNWITGFSDAESCFSIIISKRTNLRWQVSASFEINLHIKDINILYEIQKFFRVGSVTSRINKNICVLPAECDKNRGSY